MNIIDNLIQQEKKAEIKKLADEQFTKIIDGLKDYKLSEIENVFLVLEITKRLSRWHEREKARLSEEALKEKIKSN